MAFPPKLKAKILARLDELIEAGKGWLSSVRVHDKNAIVDAEPFFTPWLTSCLTLLDRIVPKDNIHRAWVESIDEEDTDKLTVEYIVGRLTGIREEVEKGYLDALALRVEAEIASDYMGQAEHLLAEGQAGKYDHVPAAVLAGAVLEKALRTLCEGQTPPIPTTKDNGEPKTMNPMIDDLKKASVYNELKAKQLRAWAGVRNHAAHGKFDEFDRGQVEDMISGINRFLGDYLG